MGNEQSGKYDILGGVLAGGLSRRMNGRDKCFIKLDDIALIDHVTARLAPQVSNIVINANKDHERFSGSNYPVISDIITGYAGPLAGIHALLDYARKTNPQITHVASVAADTPFFPDNFVETCLRSIADDEHSATTIVLAKSGQNRHPVFGLWPVKLHQSLAEFLTSEDTRKVMAFVQKHPHQFAEFEFHEFEDARVDPFFNINVPEDIDEAQSMIGKGYWT